MKAIYEDHYLTDTHVANFARQSFEDLAANFTEAQNTSLIQFLARGMSSNDWERLIDQMCDIRSPTKARELATYIRKIPEHWVPFGHPQISIRMSAPVPIARQLFKHKIGLVESEGSRRYIKSTPVLYIPDTFRAAATNIKQGSAGKHIDSDMWRAEYILHCEEAINLYERMIADNVAPEQARFVLPQGIEVNWVWTGSLYAYANMYNQRSDSHAQLESQQLAEEINQIITPLFPISWTALTQGNY